LSATSGWDAPQEFETAKNFGLFFDVAEVGKPLVGRLTQVISTYMMQRA
jgi:hypothetical protein